MNQQTTENPVQYRQDIAPFILSINAMEANLFAKGKALPEEVEQSRASLKNAMLTAQCRHQLKKRRFRKGYHCTECGNSYSGSTGDRNDF